MDVGEQPVAKGDRLGVLQVGHARGGGVDVPVGLRHQRLGQLDHLGRQPTGVSRR